MKCTVTDFVAPDLEWESREFESAGIEFESRQMRGADPALLVEYVADADVIIVDQAEISPEVIAGMGQCRAIIRHGDGYDNIHVEAATEAGIMCANKPGFWSQEVAEQTLTLVLALLRNLPQQQAAARTGLASEFPIPQRRLSDLTAGVIGLGKIGSRVSKLFSALFGRVLGYSPSLTSETTLPLSPVPLDKLLAESDIISLHFPAYADTIGIVNQAFISKMKPAACLVNTARGSIVNTDDLTAALHSGRLAGAALDVTSPEPLPPQHPLLNMPNVIVLPHLAWYSETALWNIRRSVVADVMALAAGKIPRNILNPSVINSKQFRRRSGLE